jgi:hypothetical protein
MPLDFQRSSDNPGSPAPAEKTAVAPTAKMDQLDWQTATNASLPDAQRVMARLGINNVQLQVAPETMVPAPPPVQLPSSDFTDETAGGFTGPDENRTDSLTTTSLSPTSGRFVDARDVHTEGYNPGHTTETLRTLDFHPRTELVQPVNLERDREALVHAAETNLSPKDAAAFKLNMQKFETRAKATNLSDDEVASTYQSIAFLFTAQSAVVSASNRNKLAQQVIESAVNPNESRTGVFSGTCGPTGLETIIYTRHPSVAADIIAQSAIAGEFINRDRNIKATADVIPTWESKQADNGAFRQYESQIFQSVVMNAGYKNLGDDLTYGYLHKKPKNGEDEYLVDSAGKRQNAHGTSSKDLVAAYQGLTGRNDLIVIDNHGDETDNIKHAKTPEEFVQLISRLQKEGRFPALIVVDERNQPLWSQNHIGHPASGRENPFAPYGHMITINSFNPETGAVSYHNGWDDPDHQMSVNDLFRSTWNAWQVIAPMGQDFIDSLKNGNADWSEAMDALRLRTETGRISDYDANHLFNRDLERMIAKQGTHTFDDQTVRNDALEIYNYLHNHKAYQPTPRVKQFIVQWLEVPANRTFQ